MDLILGNHPMLKKVYLDRRFKDLLEESFVADKLFTKTTTGALAVKFGVDEGDIDPLTGLPNYDNVPEVGEGSNFMRIGLTEEQRMQMIRKYGLEAAITYEMQKYGDGAAIERAYRKLAMNVRKMVDTMAYNALTNESAGINLVTKTDGYWDAANVGAENMINDLIDARKTIRDFQYDPDTVIISPTTEAMMLKNKDIRDAFKVNGTDVALLRGYIGDFMGLSFIVDANYADDQLTMLQRGVVGDIADAEGVKTLTYNEESNDRSIVRVTRFTTAYLTDPKAVVKIKNLTA